MRRRRLIWLLSAVLVMVLAMGSSMVRPLAAAGDEAGEHTIFLPMVGVTGGEAASAAAPSFGAFIVVFKPSVANPGAVAAELAQRHQGRVGFVYEHAIKGFSVSVPSTAIAGIQNDPRVDYIEADLAVHISTQDIPTGIKRSYAASNTKLEINGVDDFRVDVDVAVLDTGIDLQHPDLNVVGGIDCTLKSGGGPFATYYCGAGNGGDDDHYHGTHVAGTIGAIDNGVGVVGIAPGARLWAVKVLNSQGSGYTSGIIAGIDWVVKKGNIAVINMSLGGSGVSQAYKDAIDAAVAKGVIVVVAAGNSNDDANKYSPAYVPSAITVSALADFDGIPGGLFNGTGCRTDQDDTLADFSNWGSAIDIAAPGVCILSTYPIERGSYGTISGTSMAAPHVAGAAALLASGTKKPSNASDVQAIRNKLVNNGNFNWTDDSGDGIQEPLLDVSNTTIFAPATVAGSGSGGGSTNNPPTASFTYSCTHLTCDFTSTSTDSDGTIASYSWDFGDGATSSVTNPSHTYAEAKTYTVQLTVTDNGGKTGSKSESVAVTAPASSDGITLTAIGYKIQGNQKVDLTWSGTTGSVTIYRDGVMIVEATENNTYTYTDNINKKGGGSYKYKVCNAGTNTCSADVTVTF